MTKRSLRRIQYRVGFYNEIGHDPANKKSVSMEYTVFTKINILTNKF